MKETRIYFLRHGVTDWNTAGRWQGQTNIPLNPDGKAQAARVADRLATAKFDRIYTSDLDRALDTASTVATKHQTTPLTQTEAWRERQAGVFEGMTSDEIAQQYPEAYQQMLNGYLEPPEAETFAQMADRIRTELLRILAHHEGETLLVVSHGGTLRGMVHVTMGVPQPQAGGFEVGNTALARMSYSERGWKLDFWNDTNHLEAATPQMSASGYTL